MELWHTSDVPSRGTERAQGHRYTIDDLARLTGSSSRNLRALQSRGLLAPPRLVGRTGFYGDEDLTLLRTVLRLQARGHSLAGIADLLRAWNEGRTLDELLDLGSRPGRGHPVVDDDWTSAFEQFPPRAARSPLAAVPGFLLPTPLP
jgi:DNA-binding transcriptional MerR regulator